MKLLLTAWLMLISHYAIAQDQTPDQPSTYYLKFGGMLNEPVLTQNKLLAVGYQAPLGKLFDYQLEVGTFNDNISDFKTVYGGPSLGLSVGGDSAYVKAFCGPVFVSYTDQHLSTPIEFNTDFEIGIKDRRGVNIGVGYKHMSNAGTVGPNIGRDFVYIKVGF